MFDFVVVSGSLICLWSTTDSVSCCTQHYMRDRGHLFLAWANTPVVLPSLSSSSLLLLLCVTSLTTSWPSSSRRRRALFSTHSWSLTACLSCTSCWHIAGRPAYVPFMKPSKCVRFYSALFIFITYWNQLISLQLILLHVFALWSCKPAFKPSCIIPIRTHLVAR